MKKDSKVENSEKKKQVKKTSTKKVSTTKKKVEEKVVPENITDEKKQEVIEKTKKLDKAKLAAMMCIILVAACVFAIEKFNIRNDGTNKCAHTLIYDDEQDPGATYEMCISKKKDIIVTRKPKDDKEGITIENIQFKEENKKYIDLFMERYVGKKKKVELKISDIYMWSNEDKVIFQAVLYNDEAFLDTLK